MTKASPGPFLPEARMGNSEFVQTKRRVTEQYLNNAFTVPKGAPRGRLYGERVEGELQPHSNSAFHPQVARQWAKSLGMTRGFSAEFCETDSLGPRKAPAYAGVRRVCA